MSDDWKYVPKTGEFLQLCLKSIFYILKVTKEVKVLDLNKIAAGKNLTDLEKSILKYVVEHITEIQEMGVREIAQQIYTSPTSIIRLSKKLGYTGFTDMYYSLLPIVKKAELTPSSPENTLLDVSFSDLTQTLTEHEILQFNDKIFRKSNKYVFIYATGFSKIISEYIYKKLLVLGRKAILASGSDSIGVFENNLEDIEAVLVVSKSGETEQVYNKLLKAAEAEIYTIALTQDTKNRMALLADLNLPIKDIQPLDDRNMLPNVFFPAVLVVFEFLLEQYLEQY
jgi:DNA-binding MurR/RpiR family transcriptional regulator